MMRNRFDRQLEELNHGLIAMGSLIEQAIETAVDGLVKQNVETAEWVIFSITGRHVDEN